ncbi:HDOD domain-containing protein [bacterium]|nr:HDOD domain-containing protein [bacterium]
MISIAAVSLDIERLEPVSPTVPRLAAVITNENSGVDEIVRVIEYDPAMTANVLRLANSAYFSSPTPVSTVREAVTKIGAGQILQNAVGREIGSRFKSPCAGYELDENELWYHSVAAATAAALLPRYASMRVPPMAFTGALLHDLGKLVISRHIDKETMLEIRVTARDSHLTYVQAERRVLGFDHAQVGGLIARRWRFPDELVNCISWHHHPRNEKLATTTSDAVHIANAVARTIGAGIGIEGMNVAVNTESATALGLTPDSIEALCASTMMELPNTLELFEDTPSGIQHSHR